MCGCSRLARIRRSSRNRRSASDTGSPADRIFTATCFWNWSSLRSASQTEPIPPRPISRTRRYGPALPAGQGRLDVPRALERVQRVERTAALVLGEQRPHLRGKLRAPGAGAFDERLAVAPRHNRAPRRARGRCRSRDWSS